jgi:hypothetical protein
MNRLAIIFLTALGALAAGGCATTGDYGYDGAEYGGQRLPYDGELTGPGVALLDPWLLETEEGRAVVTLGFSEAANGVISEDVANRANIWFRRYADENCDMRITDPEIRTALVTAAGRYLGGGAAPAAPSGE